LIVAAFFVFVLKIVFSVAMLYKQQKNIGEICCRLTNRALSSYLNKPYIFHLVNNSSVLFKNISAEVSNYVYYFLNPVIVIASEIVVLSGICLLLIFVYPVMMLLLLTIFGVVTLLINFILNKRIEAYGKQREIYSEQMYKTALESLGAVKEIKAYNVQQFFTDKHLDAIKRYTDGYMKFIVVSGLPRHILELVLFTFVLAVVLFGIFFHKSSAELIPMLVVVGIASLRLLPSFYKIYSSVNFFQYGKNSSDIIYKIFREEDPAPGRVPLSIVKDADSIKLDNVDFRYETAPEPIFKKIDIAIPLRSIVALVGETGSGKSTLLDIVMGLLTPSGGEMSYRDVPLRPENMSDYRGKIGYVPQNIFLTDDTIAGNIAFGVKRDSIDPVRLKHAIAVAQLDRYISELPDGVDTLVGERGVRISGGQKQRIGIARALYRRPEILVLDEATSALDAQTESDLYNALKGLGKELSIILVTHRLSALEHADMIFCMDHGNIVGVGRYDELKANSGAFRKIIQQKH
jgi:ATP-binding cassette subfamily C protein